MREESERERVSECVRERETEREGQDIDINVHILRTCHVHEKLPVGVHVRVVHLVALQELQGHLLGDLVAAVEVK